MGWKVAAIVLAIVLAITILQNRVGPNYKVDPADDPGRDFVYPG